MIDVRHGDCRTVLPTLAAESVHCVVTSPPYFGLRDYGVDGQIGLEPTPDAYVAALVDVFREVRRVLRKDGTVWLNLGDSYAGGKQGRADITEFAHSGGIANKRPPSEALRQKNRMTIAPKQRAVPIDLKPKDLLMIPSRVALALQADGWWLRSEIIWHKPNPMPESVTDRPTSAHEKVFLLTKSARYWYDADAVREPDSGKPSGNGYKREHRLSYAGRGQDEQWQPGNGANLRNVWTISTKPYSEAHFATFPPELAERCIKAGCPADGTVMDPFGGAGTTGLVADRLGRDALLIELNPEYCNLAADRITQDGPLFAQVQT